MGQNIPKDPNPGLAAAREGRSFCGYVNAKTGIASETVLTDSTLLQEIANGKRLVMTCFYMYVSTASDWATMDFVTTANADGSGLITVHSGQFRIDTGAAVALSTPNLVKLDPPLIVDRSDGAALTVQVQGNDADAALTVMFHGWEEDDTYTR